MIAAEVVHSAAEMAAEVDNFTSKQKKTLLAFYFDK